MMSKRKTVGSLNIVSANLSITTATVFVAATAVLSLAVDRPAAPPSFGAGWMLRGAVGASSQPGLVAPPHAARQKVPRWT